MLMSLKDMEIRTSEEFVDENGDPRSDAEIYEDHILCHPETEEKLREAMELFFTQS